jgi:hypothetical protein
MAGHSYPTRELSRNTAFVFAVACRRIPHEQFGPTRLVRCSTDQPHRRPVFHWSWPRALDRLFAVHQDRRKGEPNSIEAPRRQFRRDLPDTRTGGSPGALPPGRSGKTPKQYQKEGPRKWSVVSQLLSLTSVEEGVAKVRLGYSTARNTTGTSASASTDVL